MSGIKIIVALLLVIACFSCKQGKFSVQAPEGWIINDTLSNSKDQKIKMHEPSDSDTLKFVQNIMIWFTDFPGENVYIDQVLKAVQKDAYIFENKGKGNLKINGMVFKWRQHILQSNKNEIPVEQKSFYLKQDGNIYVINCTARVNNIDSMSKEINYVLNSFKVL